MKNFVYPISITLATTVSINPVTANTKGSDDKMNIILLVVDDVRWNSIGCYGNSIVHTPNIDKLAKEGVKFDNAFATTPISSVSRASILTGQYMSRHGISDFSKEINEEKFINTYPSVLKRNNYHMGFVGKYGVGQIRESDFDYARAYEGIHWFPVDGAKTEVLSEDENGLLITKIHGDSIHVTDKNLHDAIHFLENRPKDKPFCLSVSFFAAHAQDNHYEQYRHKPSSKEYYQDISIPYPETGTSQHYHSLPSFISNNKCESRTRWYWRFDTREKYQKYIKSYYRLITEVDIAIGVIIDELKKQNMLEKTLIIFTSDNGYFQGDYQIADKWYAYEQSIRIPLIIFDPRIKKEQRGQIFKEIALNIDIAPTIISASDKCIPDIIQGKDLSLLYLRKEKKNWRNEFFFEHPYIDSEEFIPSSEGIVTLNEKYIFYPYYNYEQYFDLLKDPLEINNTLLKVQNSVEFQILKSKYEILKKQVK